MKKILVAVDGSTMASSVVAHAVELARSIGGKVRLLHAVAIPVQMPAPATFLVPTSGQLPQLVESAQELLNGLLRGVPEELRDGSGAMVEIGSPTDTILSVASSYEPDFVVIGAHEHNAIARALGTTAARIANRIDRPLLVVRPVATGAMPLTQPNRSGKSSTAA